jgi:hypothetical protein
MFDGMEFVLKVYFGLALFTAFVVGALTTVFLVWGF